MKYIDKNHFVSTSSSRNLPKKYNPSILKKRCDALACRNSEVIHLHTSNIWLPENEKDLKMFSLTGSGAEKTRRKTRTFITINDHVILWDSMYFIKERK